MIAVPMKHDGWQSCRELSDFWQVRARLDMDYPDYIMQTRDIEACMSSGH